MHTYVLKSENRERFSSGGGGGKGAATRKLPTLKFKFLLGFRSLYFEYAHAKQKKNLNIFKCIFPSKLGASPPGLKFGGATDPASPPLFPGPCVRSFTAVPNTSSCLLHGRIQPVGLGGQLGGPQPNLPPNSDFSSDFATLF